MIQILSTGPMSDLVFVEGQEVHNGNTVMVYSLPMSLRFPCHSDSCHSDVLSLRFFVSLRFLESSSLVRPA